MTDMAMERTLAIAAVLALALAGTAACARQSGGTMERLTAAARGCGFENPRFKLREGTYVLNETQVSGRPNPPLTPQQQRNWARHERVNSQWWPCLQRAASGLGVKVDFQQTVIVN